MPIDFPDSPTNGQTFTSGTRTWTWSGSIWEITSYGAQGPQGVQGVQGNQGFQGNIGSQGVQGFQGVQGAQGVKGGLFYTFSTTTTDADPGNGIFRYNAVTVSSTTQIFVDLVDGDAVTQTAFLDTWAASTSSIKGSLVVQSRSTGSVVTTFNITGVTTATGYRKISVTYLSGTAPANNEQCVIQFARAGDLGAQGPSGGAQGAQGPQGTQGFQGSGQAHGWWGSGYDGALTASSGTTTLTRNMYYTNVTLTGTAQIITNGWKIYVNGTLDLSGAQSGAIRWSGNNGVNATTNAGAAAPAASSSGQMNGWIAGLAGASGGTTNGGTGASIGNNSFWGGGEAEPGYNCGTGGNGSAGVGGGRMNPNGHSLTEGSPSSSIDVAAAWFHGSSSLIVGGNRGYSGSGGGGDGVNAGGGGGSGGTGGGIIFIAAKTINRSSLGSTFVIDARGGTGGNGASRTVGNVGGGGGGMGGGGGVIVLMYENLTGTAQTNLICADGGTGGSGGTGFGTGTNGTGGRGNMSGVITTINMSTGVASRIGKVSPTVVDNGTINGVAGGEARVTL